MAFGRGICDLKKTEKTRFNTSSNSYTPDEVKKTWFELLLDVPNYSMSRHFGGDKGHNIHVSAYQ